MQRSGDRILTTHTGSLPLPAGVREQLAAKRRGRDYDQAAIDSALTTAVGEIVRRQVEVGVDIVNDGELSKTSWNDYVVHRLSGVWLCAISMARHDITGATSLNFTISRALRVTPMITRVRPTSARVRLAGKILAQLKPISNARKRPAARHSRTMFLCLRSRRVVLCAFSKTNITRVKRPTCRRLPTLCAMS